MGVASLALWLGDQFASGRLFFQPAVNEHRSYNFSQDLLSRGYGRCAHLTSSPRRERRWSAVRASGDPCVSNSYIYHMGWEVDTGQGGRYAQKKVLWQDLHGDSSWRRVPMDWNRGPPSGPSCVHALYMLYCAFQGP